MTEVYTSGNQKKRWTPSQLKKMIKQIQKSSQKSSEISQQAEQQQRYDSHIADKKLDEELKDI